jgi:hypothetical protein
LIRWWAVVVLVLMFCAAMSWIYWNGNHLFFADFDSPALPNLPVRAEEWRNRWDALPEQQQNLLLQVSRDHMANPGQMASVKELLTKGLLRLNPDLEPASKELADFLSRQMEDDRVRERLNAWENVKSEYSWRYMRRLLVAGLVLIALFLIATQPGLQSGLTAGFGVAATALTLFANLRESLLGLLPGRTDSGSSTLVSGG